MRGLPTVPGTRQKTWEIVFASSHSCYANVVVDCHRCLCHKHCPTSSTSTMTSPKMLLWTTPPTSTLFSWTMALLEEAGQPCKST